MTHLQDSAGQVAGLEVPPIKANQFTSVPKVAGGRSGPEVSLQFQGLSSYKARKGKAGWHVFMRGMPDSSFMALFLNQTTSRLTPDDYLCRGLEGNEHPAGDGLSPVGCRDEGRR